MAQDKPFIGINHGTGQIDLTAHKDSMVIQMLPSEIHLKEDGDLNNGPSFAIVNTNPSVPAVVVGQISLKMFNEGLSDIGYEIVKKQ